MPIKLTPHINVTWAYELPPDIKLNTFYDSRWPKEPLSVKELCANPHYRRWARKYYGLGPLARVLLTMRRKEGHRETRDEMFKAIAKLLGVDWKKVKHAANRSSKVIPKRRQQI
jgi:hypothetical protein